MSRRIVKDVLQVISFRDAVPYSRQESLDRLKRALASVDTAPLVDNPVSQHLGLRIPKLNDALLLIEIEPHESGCRPALWLSTYGLAPAALDAARTQFAQLYRTALQ
jgi:hypothetical protein